MVDTDVDRLVEGGLTRPVVARLRRPVSPLSDIWILYNVLLTRSVRDTASETSSAVTSSLAPPCRGSVSSIHFVGSGIFRRRKG
jgi:hypothetical protein